MKAAAYVLFVLAGLATLAAINNVFLGGANRPERIENLAGYAVGSFLLPLIFVVAGLTLLNKQKSRQ